MEELQYVDAVDVPEDKIEDDLAKAESIAERLTKAAQRGYVSGKEKNAAKRNLGRLALAAAGLTGRVRAYKRIGDKLGRNDPCFCGSGKKFKRCCMSEEA